MHTTLLSKVINNFHFNTIYHIHATKQYLKPWKRYVKIHNTCTHQNHHRINVQLLYQSIESNTEMKLKQIKTLKELITHTADLSSPQRNTYQANRISMTKSIATGNIYTHGNQAPGYNTRAEKKVLKTPSEKLPVHEFICIYARLTWQNVAVLYDTSASACVI